MRSLTQQFCQMDLCTIVPINVCIQNSQRNMESLYYVDDMLIFGMNMKGVCETKRNLSSMFQMKDLNEVDTILGIKIKRHSEGFALCQSHYVEKVLQRFKLLNIKEVNTPFNQSIKLGENTGSAIAQLEYVSAIGSMMYTIHCTRPNISFLMGQTF